MTPYYDQDGITIYHGDCREILPALEPGSVDLVLTDPPYGIVNQFGANPSPAGTRRKQFDFDQGDDVASAVADGVGAALALCVKQAACFIFTSVDSVGAILPRLREYGFTVKPAAWMKTSPPPAGMGNWWPSAFELAIYGYRNGAYFVDRNPKRCNVFVGDSYRHGQPGKVAHPTQKPLWLMNRLAKAMLRPAGMCLDPYCGSGSTLVAVKAMNGRAIGIEICEQYCEIAARRLAQGVFDWEPVPSGAPGGSLAPSGLVESLSDAENANYGPHRDRHPNASHRGYPPNRSMDSQSLGET